MATVIQDESISDFDPITFSVIRNRFEAVGQEMTLAMEQTAWTSVIALARDYSCMIYDAHEDGPRQVTMAECLPIHCNSIRTLLVEIVSSFEGDIHDGDIYMCNDPYRGNTHIPDLVTAQPVFVEGKQVFGRLRADISLIAARPKLAASCRRRAMSFKKAS